MAACAPISGFAPAPKPEVKLAPNCILLGTELFSNACESVLQITKSTPLICCVNMWFTALLPPPPTPITFIVLDCVFGMLNEMLSNSVLIITFYYILFFLYYKCTLKRSLRTHFFYSALSKKSLRLSVNLSKNDFFFFDFGFSSMAVSFSDISALS